MLFPLLFTSILSIFMRALQKCEAVLLYHTIKKKERGRQAGNTGVSVIELTERMCE